MLSKALSLSKGNNEIIFLIDPVYLSFFPHGLIRILWTSTPLPARK